MVAERYLHSELTGKIMGCAMEVHRVLSNGFHPRMVARGGQNLTYEKFT
jgi:hypothetical protein